MDDLEFFARVLLLAMVLIPSGVLFAAMRRVRRVTLRQVEVALGRGGKAILAPGEPLFHQMGGGGRVFRYVVATRQRDAQPGLVRALRRDVWLERAYSLVFFSAMLLARALLVRIVDEEPFWGIGAPFELLVDFLVVLGLLPTAVGVWMEWHAERAVRRQAVEGSAGSRPGGTASGGSPGNGEDARLLWGSWLADAGTGTLRLVAIVSLIVTIGRPLLRGGG